MATKRRQSVPSAVDTFSQGNTSTGLAQSKPTSMSSSQSSTGDCKFLAPADAIARMTLERSVRILNEQVKAMQPALGELVAKKKDDENYRTANQPRLDELYREMVAVKVHMKQVQNRQSTQDSTLANLEQSRIETQNSIGQLRNENQNAIEELGDRIQAKTEQLKKQLSDHRALVERTCKQLGSLPTAADIDDKYFDEYFQSFATQHSSKSTSIYTHTSMLTGVSTDQSSPSPSRIQRRIDETIRSTRRWNRDYKETKLGEQKFTAHYFWQQGKRDPKMALLIQKCVQKRVKARRATSRSAPASLEEFCLDVKWSDITEVIDSVLVGRKDPEMMKLL